MTPDAQIRHAAQAALQALSATENATRAAIETLTALLAALSEASPIPDDWVDLDSVVQRYPVTRRAVLDARRKGNLRASKPPGSRSILMKLADVEAWINGKKPTPRTAVVTAKAKP